MRRIVLVLSLVSAVACGAPATPAVAPAAEIDEPEWAGAVRELARREPDPALVLSHVQGVTDAAGPRLAGSAGDPLAVAWGVARMRELGLVEVRAEPVTVRAWRRGEERVDVIAPVPHRIAAAALGGSVGTPAGGIEAEVVRVATLEELDALPRARAAGKIVFVDHRMERTRDGSGYGASVGVRAIAASRAARLGAVAVLIRSIGTDDTRFPHTGSLRYEDDAPRIPAAAASNPDADVLARWILAGQTVRLRMELGCSDGGDAQSANVVGEVRGSDRAQEIVLLGAHLDSWDLGHGAIDDGAGIAIVLEVARRIATAETPPRRTIRVVLFANEENGGAGSRAYAAAHEAELAGHVLALEADFGDGRAFGFLTPDRSAPFARIAQLLAPLDVSWDEDEPHGGADLRPLRERGIPVADVMQDGTRYFDLHHTANDVLTQVDPASLDHAMRAMLTVAYAASLDLDLPPPTIVAAPTEQDEH